MNNLNEDTGMPPGEELQVFKFGGASIVDAASIRSLTNLLLKYRGRPLILVISALGKTTNALEQVLNCYLAGDVNEAIKAFVGVRDDHLQICRDLIREKNNPVWIDLNELLVEVEWLLEDDLHDSPSYLYDQIVCLGELISTRIIAAYMLQEGLDVRWADARGLLITDDSYSEAVPDLVESRERLNQFTWRRDQQWLIVQGFIGGTDDNNSTTLGREGSDYSAVLFAHLAGAQEVTLWKDVDGIYITDPKQDPKAERLEEMSFDEALAIVESGSKVIHPKALRLAKDEGMTIRVKSFLQPDGVGSIIG